MAVFFRSTRLWVADFRFDGRARRWVSALPSGTGDARAVFSRRLADSYAERAVLVDVRPATHEEETQYIGGTLARNGYCPALRGCPAP